MCAANPRESEQGNSVGINKEECGICHVMHSSRNGELLLTHGGDLT